MTWTRAAKLSGASEHLLFLSQLLLARAGHALRNRATHLSSCSSWHSCCRMPLILPRQPARTSASWRTWTHAVKPSGAAEQLLQLAQLPPHAVVLVTAAALPEGRALSE
jgi:hypothetical protein